MNQRTWPHQPSQPDSTASGQGKPAGPLTIEEKVLNVIRQVYDPEIPVNIVDLGLIYETTITPAADPSPFGSSSGTAAPGPAVDVHVVMTLTTPNCPEAEAIPSRVKQVIERIPEVVEAQVDIVWDPPWDRHMMSEDARLLLGLD